MESYVSESLGIRVSQYEGFISTRGILAAIPKDFVPVSCTYGGLRINPNTKLSQILERIKDYTVLYQSGGLENGCRSSVYSIREKGYFYIEITKGNISAHFYARDDKSNVYLKEIIDKFKDFKISNRDRGGVWSNFSYMASNGEVSRFNEFLKCPTWKSINHNYPDGVRAKIETLFSIKKPWEKGRLVILSGPAGTGKTYFIRSLMMSWRKNFEFCVVTDPERFASDPSYYYDIGSRIVASTYDEEDDTYLPTAINSRFGKKKVTRSLIILEDSADLILSESRQKHFDKIGKLLNMTDGLLGQGREDIFLITFNEDVKDIDPAFLRPGRCLLNAEFREFEEAEAKEWIESHGNKDFEVTDKMTLAQMYAALYAKEELKNTPEEARLGFHS